MKNRMRSSVMGAAGLLAATVVGTFVAMTMTTVSWGQSAQVEPGTVPAITPTTTSAVTVVVDAGHGGSDLGATAKSANEKDVNLAVARQLQNVLASEGIRVVMTRTDDTSKTIGNRGDVATHEKPTCFISLHCEPKATGYSVLYHGNSASGKMLAADIARHNAQTFGQASGKTAPDTIELRSGLGVLRKSSPVSAAVLVNCPGVAQMTSTEAQTKAARAIAAGVREFVKGSAQGK